MLVVDDEADSRLLIRHVLEDFGCQVFTAVDGQEGLALAKKIRPDLMMLDLIMPGVNGWEVLRRAKADEDLRAIPIVIVSVVANEGRGKLLGAVDLVTKPFEREDLLRVLWRNLGRRRGGRVLLMVGEGADPDDLARIVEATGLDVARAKGGDLMSILGQEAPDAVVLDLGLPGMHGVASLLELRDDRLHTGLPVMVITHTGLNDKEREIVHEMATLHSGPSDAPATLQRLLDASFSLAGAPVSEE